MSFLTNGAGLGPAGAFNHLVAAPGQRIALGNSGGTLLLSPPGGAPGSMTFQQMQNKIWHLLREDGPYTGYPIPLVGDYAQQVLQADINLAISQFISDTGLAPDLTDRADTFSVLPVLDQPLPPGCISLTRLEYTPAGQQTYVLLPLSFTEFDTRCSGLTPTDLGQPFFYRKPFAGYTRFTPQPTQGNAVGPGIGTISILGIPGVGNVYETTLTNPGSAPIVLNYVVTSSDTLSTIANNISNLIKNSNAVVGAAPFLAPASPVSNTISLTALNAPGTSITYSCIVVGNGGLASPNASTTFAPNGDTITWYYSSLGITMVNPGDVPGIPPPFHIALCYRVLADYWDRKGDPGQAKSYMQKYMAAVLKAKAFTFDSDRATQPTLAGNLDDDSTIGGW